MEAVMPGEHPVAQGWVTTGKQRPKWGAPAVAVRNAAKPGDLAAQIEREWACAMCGRSLWMVATPPQNTCACVAQTRPPPSFTHEYQGIPWEPPAIESDRKWLPVHTRWFKQWVKVGNVAGREKAVRGVGTKAATRVVLRCDDGCRSVIEVDAADVHVNNVLLPADGDQPVGGVRGKPLPLQCPHCGRWDMSREEEALAQLLVQQIAAKDDTDPVREAVMGELAASYPDMQWGLGINAVKNTVVITDEKTGMGIAEVPMSTVIRHRRAEELAKEITTAIDQRQKQCRLGDAHWLKERRGRPMNVGDRVVVAQAVWERLAKGELLPGVAADVPWSDHTELRYGVIAGVVPLGVQLEGTMQPHVYVVNHYMPGVTHAVRNSWDPYALEPWERWKAAQRGAVCRTCLDTGWHGAWPTQPNMAPAHVCSCGGPHKRFDMDKAYGGSIDDFAKAVRKARR